MKWTIESIETKTSRNNKTYAVIFARSEGGEEQKAAMWDGYAGLAVGQTVEMEFVGGEFPKFRLPSAAGPAWRGGSKSQDIKVAQEMKREAIRDAQENKEIGIKLAGAMRDATMVSVQSYKDQPFPTDTEFKEEWRKWRDWFIKEYESEADRLKNQPF